MRRADPFAPIMIWHSADWRADPRDLPIFRHDWHLLLEQCRVAVERREAAYPQLVRAGRMEAGLADSDIAAWRALHAEWQWIITGEGECPDRASLPDRIAAAQLALQRVDGELQRQWSEDLIYQRHLLQAIAWHLGDGRAAPAIHFTASLNHNRPKPPVEKASA